MQRLQQQGIRDRPRFPVVAVRSAFIKRPLLDAVLTALRLAASGLPPRRSRAGEADLRRGMRFFDAGPSLDHLFVSLGRAGRQYHVHVVLQFPLGSGQAAARRSREGRHLMEDACFLWQRGGLKAPAPSIDEDPLAFVVAPTRLQLEIDGPADETSGRRNSRKHGKFIVHRRPPRCNAGSDLGHRLDEVRQRPDALRNRHARSRRLRRAGVHQDGSHFRG